MGSCSDRRRPRRRRPGLAAVPVNQTEHHGRWRRSTTNIKLLINEDKDISWSATYKRWMVYTYTHVLMYNIIIPLTKGDLVGTYIPRFAYCTKRHESRTEWILDKCITTLPTPTYNALHDELLSVRILYVSRDDALFVIPSAYIPGAGRHSHNWTNQKRQSGRHPKNVVDKNKPVGAGTPVWSPRSLQTSVDAEYTH